MNPLEQVAKAAAGKRRAEGTYLRALTLAHKEGASFAQIAKAAGTSRQNVRQMLERRHDEIAAADRASLILNAQ